MRQLVTFFSLAAKNALTWVWNALSDFFLVEVTPLRAGILRIIFGCVLLALVLLTAHNPAEFFTSNGAFPLDLQRPFAGDGAVSLFYWITDPALTVLLYWVMVASIIAFTLGFYPRAMLVIAWVLWLSFMQRTPFITNGSDRVMRGLIFPLLFLDTSRALIPPFLQRFAPKEKKKTVPGWSIRVMQIQTALVYTGAFFIKWPYPDWQDGSYFFQLLNNPNYSLIDGYWLHNWPIIVIFATYFALAGELLAAPFLFTLRTRKVMLAWLVAFHIGVLLFSNVVLFSWVMFAALSVFLLDGEWETIVRTGGLLLAKLRRRTMSA